MAIDIMSLQVPTATLVNSNSAPAVYRVNSDKIREDLQKAKDDGNVKDLLQLSGRTADEINNLKAESPDGVKRICNYSLDSFFRKDMPQISNSDGSYTIGGVKFTEEELIMARDIMKTVADSISAGAGKNINLDYRNYAEMALAENAVSQFAKNNFDEEKQNVISKAMKEYNAGLMELQDELLSKREYVHNDYGKISDYYGLSRVMTESDAAAINKMKEEIGKLTGGSSHLSKAGDIMGMEQIATNKDLINNISETFRNVDLSDKEAVKNAMNKYQELVRPAYQAIDKSQAEARKETEGFMSMLNKIMANKSYKSVDFMI